MLVLLLGSNIGNFDMPAAHDFLCAIRGALAPGDALLLGADLVKPERDLQLAYDDPLGVTAAFNRNLLVRINRELGGTFDLDAFAHVAVWNPAHQPRRDAPREPRRSARDDRSGGRVGATSRAASGSGPRARTSTSRRRSTRWD